VSSYEWNAKKAEANRRKHGVTFLEAEEALDDPRSHEHPDTEHSFGDVRIRTIGYTMKAKLIVVVTSVDGPRPRIISARRATKRERDAYTNR